MNDFTDSHLDALFEAARAQRPDTSRAEYAFETRLKARLHGRDAEGALSSWAQISWRLIPVLGLLVLGLLVWEREEASTAQETQQISYLQNQDAGDLVASFN
jgi:hypothetical protein